jgi:hypothetical protein
MGRAEAWAGVEADAGVEFGVKVWAIARPLRPKIRPAAIRGLRINFIENSLSVMERLKFDESLFPACAGHAVFCKVASKRC